MKPRLVISACLLGERARYDGRDKLDAFLKDELGRLVEWVPVCPERECGLGVPREMMRLEGDPSLPRLVTRETKIDQAERMKAWADSRLAEIEKLGVHGIVLKARSPSCGLHVEVFDATGAACGFAAGLWARAFMDRFPQLPAREDEPLHNPAVCEAFLAAVRKLSNRKGR